MGQSSNLKHYPNTEWLAALAKAVEDGITCYIGGVKYHGAWFPAKTYSFSTKDTTINGASFLAQKMLIALRDAANKRSWWFFHPRYIVYRRNIHFELEGDELRISCLVYFV